MMSHLYNVKETKEKMLDLNNQILDEVFLNFP